MLSKRQWLIFVIFPFVAAMGIDQLSKHLWAELDGPLLSPYLFFASIKNTGFFGGSLSEISRLYTTLIPAGLGGLLFFVYLVAQFFLPFEFLSIRVGLSIFCGAALGNIIDRLYFGHVRDFLLVRVADWESPVFNLADAWQWFGVGVFLFSYVKNGRIFYPISERRGRRWIDPAFQSRYCAILLGVGFSFALMIGLVSYTFLAFIADYLQAIPPADERKFLVSYGVIYGVVTTIFLTVLFIAGVWLSHRIIGPIKSFESFLDGILVGKASFFKLRRNDEFKQFEVLADRFRSNFHGQLGIHQDHLQVGMAAPDFEATTIKDEQVTLANLTNKLSWIIFYRYAGCPLCTYHLYNIRDAIVEARKADIRVLIVYESDVTEFSASKNPELFALITELEVDVIPDPDRALFHKFRTMKSLRALLHPKALVMLIKALLKRFKQRRMTGDLRAVPAHFILDREANVLMAYYGDHIADHAPINEIRKFLKLV